MINRRASRNCVRWWLISFVGLQVGFCVAIETFLVKYRDPAFAAHQEMLDRAIRQDMRRPLSLIFGSSRALHGIRPSLLDKEGITSADDPILFNCADLARGPTHCFITLTNLLRNQYHPQSVIVELAPHQLFIDVQEKDNVGTLNLTLRDLRHYNKFSHHGAKEYIDWVETRALPTYTYRREILDQHLPRLLFWNQRMDGWRGIESDGFLPYPLSEFRQTALQKTQDEVQGRFEIYRIAEVNVRAIDAIVELCRKESIQLIFLFMPESPTYRSWYTEIAKLRIRQLQDDLRQRHGLHVIDAHDWLNDEMLFADGHHLLPQGAAQFTRRFGEVVLPILRKQKSETARSNEH